MILKKVGLVKNRLPTTSEFNILRALNTNPKLRYEEHKIDDFYPVFGLTSRALSPVSTKMFRRMLRNGLLTHEGIFYSITPKGQAVLKAALAVSEAYDDDKDTVEVPD